MPDKGKIISQTYYERQSRLLKLYQESFVRNEMDIDDTATALRMIGFSKTCAANRVSEWAMLIGTDVSETAKAKKQRQKQQASLERYVLQMRLGKKYYLRLKYKRKELSKDEVVKKLMQKGYSQETSNIMVDEWGAEL